MSLVLAFRVGGFIAASSDGPSAVKTLPVMLDGPAYRLGGTTSRGNGET